MDWFLYDNGLRHERVKITEISNDYLPDHFWKKLLTMMKDSIRMRAYQEVTDVHFSENLASFVSSNTRFEISPFTLLPTK